MFLSYSGLGLQGCFQDGCVIFVFEQVGVGGVSGVGERGVLRLEAKGGLFIPGGEYVE